MKTRVPKQELSVDCTCIYKVTPLLRSSQMRAWSWESHISPATLLLHPAQVRVQRQMWTLPAPGGKTIKKSYYPAPRQEADVFQRCPVALRQE